MTNDRAFNMDFGKVYGILTDKACRKGRTAEKVAEVTCRLTGYTPAQIAEAAGQTLNRQEKMIFMLRRI